MIQILNGDLLKSNATYICHQVNCMGVMGAGIAKQIKEQYPDVFFEYHALCKRYQSNPASLLGDAQAIHISKTRPAQYICNLFGQIGYSRNSVQTNLPALKKSCKKIAYFSSPEEIIAMPYRIGCGLAGGDWGDVMDMLAEVFNNRTLHLYKL